MNKDQVSHKNILAYPTSYTQRRMWFLGQLENDFLVNNSTMEVKFCEIEEGVLEKALQILSLRHENFWTNFRQTTSGEIVQIINKPREVKINFFDITNELEILKEEIKKEIIEENTNKKFDLALDVLFRATLIKITEDNYLFLLTFHHIVSDAWTLAFLWKELSEIYDSLKFGEQYTNPKPTFQYRDYAAWEQSSDYLSRFEKQKEYWLAKLSGAPSNINLPFDYLRPKAQTYNHDSIKGEFVKEEIKKINAVCLSLGITTYTFFLAGFFILLNKLSGQKDIVVGTYSANRDQADMERVSGAFLNNLALRSYISDSDKLTEFIVRLNQSVLEATTNKDYPFEKIIEELKIERDSSYPPLFNVVFQLFNLDNNLLKDIFVNRVCGLDFYNSNFFQHEIVLQVGIEDDRMRFYINYNLDLFKKKTIQKMVQAYHDLIIQMSSSQKVQIENIKIVSFVATKDLQLRNRLQKDSRKKEVKIDRAMLKRVEREIIKIWQEVLGLSAISSKDNFFRLGGHSLKLIQVHKKLEKIYPRKINIADLFKFPTVTDLAFFIISGEKEKAVIKKEKPAFGQILDDVREGELSVEATVEKLLDL